MNRETGPSQSGIPTQHDSQNLQDTIGSFPFLEKIPLAVQGHIDDALVYLRDDIVLRPEHIARLPSTVIDIIAALPVENLDKYLPGYLDGRYLRNQYSRNPSGFVPNEQLINQILFAGENNIEGLKLRIMQRLERLNNRFPYPYKNHFKESDGRVRTINLSNIHKVLGIVEKFMESGGNRRTGEPAFAHILRVLDRGIDLIYLMNSLPQKGLGSLVFTPEVAEVFLEVLATHDFTEDKSKQHTDNGDVIRQGRIQLQNDTYNPSRNGITLSIIEYGEINQIDDKAGEPDRTLESINIEINPAYTEYFMSAVKALNSDNFPVGKSIEGLLLQSKEKRGKVTLVDPSQMILQFMAEFAKCLDRTDNFDTTTFEMENGVYIPRKVEKIHDKAVETIRQFPDVELLVRLGTNGWYRPPLSAELFSLMTFHKLLSEIETPPEILASLPTRRAKLMLLGLNQNQIYRNDYYGGLFRWPPLPKPR